jgi:hypothetical protein
VASIFSYIADFLRGFASPMPILLLAAAAAVFAWAARAGAYPPGLQLEEPLAKRELRAARRRRAEAAQIEAAAGLPPSHGEPLVLGDRPPW